MSAVSSGVCSSDLSGRRSILAKIEIVAQMSYIVRLTREIPMAATAFVRARIDETLKDEAAAVLAELGLTVSDVVRMTLTRVAKDHALPFELKVPNADTRAALESSRATMKARRARFTDRSEEHTSDLQSLMRISYAVFCLNKKNYIHTTLNTI